MFALGNSTRGNSVVEGALGVGLLSAGGVSGAYSKVGLGFT